jgi:hypothetical protein
MSQQPKDSPDAPTDRPPVDETVDNDDQDSEPTMKAPDDRRPDGTVADLHGEGASTDAGGSGAGGS